MIQETESHGVDQQDTSLIEPIYSSYIVHDTMLTTQDPHSGEGMHVGAYPDVIIITTWAPEVFTSNLVDHPTSVETSIPLT